MKSAEEILSKNYNSNLWNTYKGITEDAKQSEDLRDCAKEYVSKCRLRLLKYIPIKGTNILDMASGPIQYPEYLEYSVNYEKRYCIDLSSKALEDAKNKLGEHGIYLHGSFFDIPLEANYFDCAISLHTIYHIDKDKQEEAVRKLLSVTKPGNPVIIVYSNPQSLESILIYPLKILLNCLKALREIRFLKKSNKFTHQKNYFKRYPLKWWIRFDDIADVKIRPWRTFSAKIQKVFFPNNFIGKYLFQLLFKAESRFSRFFTLLGTYPIIILTKR